MLLSSGTTIARSIRAASVAPDVTGAVEYLGNPTRSQYPDGPAIYARNVWDLHTYRGRLFIGAGNSSNLGPAPNAGPAPIWSYDPRSAAFREEYRTDDEQVDSFQLLDDGQLYVPGHDPKEDWSLGNFYRLEADGRWHKHRTIPDGIHSFAMASFRGELFAGIGAYYGQPAPIHVSKDRGATWAAAGTAGYMRIASFLHSGGSLFATGLIPSQRVPPATPPAGPGTPRWLSERERATFAFVSEYDGATFVERPDLTPGVMFPDTDFPALPFSSASLNSTAVQDSAGPKSNNPGDLILQMKIVRPIPTGARTAFLGAFSHNDMQALPFGLYVADSLAKGAVRVRRIKLPPSSRPWDIIVHDGVTYALLESAEETGTTVRVLRSRDLTAWSELFHFRSPTFARSFERLDGDFYFGLGCEPFDPRNWTQDKLASETGNILRLALRGPG